MTMTYGHGNLWGEGGKASTGTKGATDGGLHVSRVICQHGGALPDLPPA